MRARKHPRCRARKKTPNSYIYHQDLKLCLEKESSRIAADLEMCAICAQNCIEFDLQIQVTSGREARYARSSRYNWYLRLPICAEMTGSGLISGSVLPIPTPPGFVSHPKSVLRTNRLRGRDAISIHVSDYWKDSMNTIVLLTALAAGQLPDAPPSGGVALPAIPQPGVRTQLPMPTMPPAGMPMGMPMMNGNGAAQPEEPKPDAPEPYALMRLLQTTQFGQGLTDRGISISGWAQGSYTASSANRSNLPITFNDRADFFQMNQHFLRIN